MSELIRRNITLGLKRKAMPVEVLVIGIFLLLKQLYFGLNIGIHLYLLFINILSSIGAVLIILSFSGFFKRRTRFLLLIAFDAVVTITIIADLFFFRHFSGMVNARSLPVAIKYLFNETSIFSLFRWYDVFLILDFFIVYPIKKYTLRDCSSIKGRLPFVLISGIVGISFIASSIVQLDKHQPGIRNYFYSKVYITQAVGNLTYHGLDLYRDLSLRVDEYKYKHYSVEEMQNWFMEKNKNKVNNLFGVGNGKNIIVIQVESMSEFMINKKINGMEITPNLNEFLKKSIYFDNFYSEIGHGGTSDSEFTSNVSMYPVSKGAAFTDHASGDYYSVADIMKDKGYYNVAMEADQPGFWNIDMMYRSLGFDSIMDGDDYYHDEDIGMGLGDGSFFKQSMEMLNNINKPFYSFMVTLSSHGPFYIPDKYRKEINVTPYFDKPVGRYIESLHYTDKVLGEFLKDLDNKGLMDKSIIIIYGDHQVPIGRNDADLLDFLGYKNGIDDFNWLKLQKVPMMIHIPGTEGSVNHIAGGHVDIPPTLMNIMGVDTKGYPFIGDDLLNTSKGFAVSRNGYFIDDEYIGYVTQNTAYRLKDGEKIDISAIPEEVKKYNQCFGYSDIIIRDNLMKKLKLDN